MAASLPAVLARKHSALSVGRVAVGGGVLAAAQHGHHAGKGGEGEGGGEPAALGPGGRQVGAGDQHTCVGREGTQGAGGWRPARLCGQGGLGGAAGMVQIQKCKLGAGVTRARKGGRCTRESDGAVQLGKRGCASDVKSMRTQRRRCRQDPAGQARSGRCCAWDHSLGTETPPAKHPGCAPSPDLVYIRRCRRGGPGAAVAADSTPARLGRAGASAAAPSKALPLAGAAPASAAPPAAAAAATSSAPSSAPSVKRTRLQHAVRGRGQAVCRECGPILATKGAALPASMFYAHHKQTCRQSQVVACCAREGGKRGQQGQILTDCMAPAQRLRSAQQPAGS